MGKNVRRNHLAAINLRTQMEQYRRSIKDEMRKIAESYKSDYEIALTRQTSLESSLANVVVSRTLLAKLRSNCAS